MIIADLQYFPPVSFFSTSFTETNVVFNECDVYRKMSFRNRCLIAGANNLIGLSIPLEGGRQQKVAMKELRVSETEPWQKQHWRSLTSAYNRSPFFDHYAQELEKLYQTKALFLLDWNRTCMEWIKAKTGWPPAIHFLSSELSEVQTGEKRFLTDGGILQDWRNRLMPKNYLSFPAPVYHQVFGETRGFQANLSVLDLLFNAGPQSATILAGL